MLSRLLREEIERRNIAVREAAKQIGVSHSTIYAIFNRKPLEVETAYLVCKWLNVPFAAAIDHDDCIETAAVAIEIMLRKVPALKDVFIQATQELNNGRLTPEDFNDVVEFAAFKILKAQGALHEPKQT